MNMNDNQHRHVLYLFDELESQTPWIKNLDSHYKGKLKEAFYGKCAQILSNLREMENKATFYQALKILELDR